MVIRFTVLERALEPYASWTSFPTLCTLVFFRGGGIDVGDPYIKDDEVLVGEFGFSLALDVDEGVIDPAAGQVQVLVHTVPFLGIERAP